MESQSGNIPYTLTARRRLLRHKITGKLFEVCVTGEKFYEYEGLEVEDVTNNLMWEKKYLEIQKYWSNKQN